jgi:hypothetical protein
MKVKVLLEAGLEQALLGLSLSYEQPLEGMSGVAQKLYRKEGGHNKFLESIAVWLDIIAPRYWWQQLDTYRVGMTKQSGSTMHTILKRKLAYKDFSRPIAVQTLDRLNGLIAGGLFEQLKAELPEGFLQRRICCTNYQTIRRIIRQRKFHRLPEWQVFVRAMFDQLEHQEFLEDLKGMKEVNS